jgi:hypothetical protein
LPELVTVGDRFVVRPLLPLLTANGHFYVLTLTQDEIRLYQGTHFALDQVRLDGLPLAVWLTMPRRQSPVYAFADRAGSPGPAMFHTRGDDSDTLVLRHFQRADRALRELLGSDQAPLVLTGDRSLQAVYRRANTHSPLLTTGIDGDPWGHSPDQLHRRIWPLVEPVLRSQETAAATANRALHGSGRTSSDPAEVLAAAHQGRIETLFLSTDTPEWRTRARGGPVLRLDNTPSTGERLDLAAVATLRHAGSVYVVPPTRMPGTTPLAATLRR